MASSSPLFAKALALWLLAALGFASYVCLDQGWLGPLSPEKVDPSQGPPAADLGTVLIPSGTPPGKALTYVWRVDTLAPPRSSCVYEELMRTNTEPVRQLGEPFLEFIHAHQLNSAQAADLIIGFVQRIHYE